MTVKTEMFFKFICSSNWSAMLSLHAVTLILLLTMNPMKTLHNCNGEMFSLGFVPLCKIFLWMTRYFLSFLHIVLHNMWSWLVATYYFTACVCGWGGHTIIWLSHVRQSVHPSVCPSGNVLMVRHVCAYAYVRPAKDLVMGLSAHDQTFAFRVILTVINDRTDLKKDLGMSCSW